MVCDLSMKIFSSLLLGGVGLRFVRWILRNFLWPILREPISFTSFGKWAGEEALKTLIVKDLQSDWRYRWDWQRVCQAGEALIEVVYELALPCLDSS
jgi:hypothetical protein